ncbi:hypothetical protein BEUL_2316 [Bifidobacterium eulemuris]|uniref:Uncharacterized protein n=1 Tax=Bifidobacterium eulemuris TaxID=1765219 RepID=A0A261FXF4_9BIFI|nr:hypothetical protein BEUL_2316 [Bifidobacterium eulemuris]
MVTCLTAGVDRNNFAHVQCRHIGGSPASRQVWIETRWALISSHVSPVTCLTAGVDRNTLSRQYCRATECHLPHGRCGSKPDGHLPIRQDEGHLPHGRCGSKRGRRHRHARRDGSPASRQVWIETPSRRTEGRSSNVTCLTAGVDRNQQCAYMGWLAYRSPASRQVWIETYRFRRIIVLVASPASRQVWIETRTSAQGSCGPGHLPHGRCGSKHRQPAARGHRPASPASRQVWIETCRRSRRSRS